VLRPGGPAAKGHTADIVTGILGVLLLVGAVVLVQVLPVHEYANPRFRLSFPDTTPDLASGSQVFTLVEGSAPVIEYQANFTDDNIVSIALSASFLDDKSASHPDNFRITLIDPDGQAVGQPQLLSNPEPHPKSPQEPTTYIDERAIGSWPFALHEHPQEQIVQGKSRTETAEQALARLEPQFRIHTKGTWTVKIELLNAGDCPSAQDPDPNPGTLTQGAVCTQNNQGSTADPGNDFVLENVIPTFFTPTVTELK
jgi:hypothetical protein